MELPSKKIPQEFLSSMPDGIKLEQKQERIFLVVEKILCPEGHDIIEDKVQIHGEPSIRVKADTGKSCGHLYIDAFWGGHRKLFDFVPVFDSENMDLSVSCPICDTSLMVKRNCNYEGCDSQDSFILPFPGGQNKIYVCARLGCPGHHIEVQEVSGNIIEQVDEINYFQTYEDDLFQGI